MRLVILGAESIGREAAEIALVAGRYEAVVFLDDAPALAGGRVMSLPVAGGFGGLAPLVSEETEFFVAIGTARMRDRWMATVRDAGGRLASLVHPGAHVSSFAVIGPNTLINFGCHIGPNVKMNEGNVLWSSVVISHDCTVGRHCFFGPTVAVGGYTHIGDHSMFGCGAKLRPCITVGSRVVIGMGAIVVRPVADDHFVAAGADPIPIEGMSAEEIFFGRVRTLPRDML